MKKRSNKLAQTDLKNRPSRDAHSARGLSKAEVQRNNSLKLFDQKSLDARRDNDTSSGASRPTASKRTGKATKINAANEMEFLFSQNTKKHTTNRVSLHVQIHVALLVLGLLGSMACLWAMLYTSDTERVALKLGLERVANSLENVMSVLAIPALMFTVILTIYSIQQLYFAYRRANYLVSGGHRRIR